MLMEEEVNIMFSHRGEAGKQKKYVANVRVNQPTPTPRS